MGGTWDSTNVADGDVAVFTPIDLDHTERLGNTIQEIATTKAGIIKPAAIVVSAQQTIEAEEVLVRTSAEVADAFALLGSQFEITSQSRDGFGQRFSVRGLAGADPASSALSLSSRVDFRKGKALTLPSRPEARLTVDEDFWLAVTRSVIWIVRLSPTMRARGSSKAGRYWADANRLPVGMASTVPGRGACGQRIGSALTTSTSGICDSVLQPAVASSRSCRAITSAAAFYKA